MGLVQGHGINDMPWGWASENEWNKRVYRLWCGKLRCCYDDNFHKTKKGETYIDCTVCERWLTLSNFVEDVPLIDGYDEERFLMGELELDKDIRSNGTNKQYIMNECAFVTHKENQQQAVKTRDNVYLQGRELSEETKQKMSESHKGKYHTEETRHKMSENNGMKNKFGSECPNSKKVAQYNKQSNELIKIWDSMHDVERELGIANSSVSKCCRGKLKTAGGYIWKYVE